MPDAAIDELSGWFGLGIGAARTQLEPPESSAPEPTTVPWTFKAADAPPFQDPARFWRSTGYLYDRGQLNQAVPDPVAASGWMVAGSSARRNLTQHRFRTPEWLLENCTGCGRCWALCPDSALPATALSARDLIDAGVDRLKASGQAVTQLGRVAGHLATQVDQAIAHRGPDFPRAAGPLLERAFETLADRMGLEGATRSTMQSEVAKLADLLKNWPMAVTRRWYEEAEAGQGRLLTIAFNPSACKGCGVCISACPDDAFDWRDYSPEAEVRDREVWRLRMELPDASQDDIADSDRPFADLFSRRSYHSLVGGDAAQPGSGVKTALHLVTAAVEAEAARRAERYERDLQDLARRLRSAVQQTLDKTVEVNDFEDFRRRLDSSVARGADFKAALDATGQGADEAATRRVQALLDVLADVDDLAHRVADRASGLFMVLGEGQQHLHGAIYPDNPFANPWIAVGSDPLGLGAGLFDGLVEQSRRDQALLRRAERCLTGRGEDETPTPRWAEFDASERLRVPPVLVVAGAMELDWRRVSDTLAGDRPIRIILVDDTGPGPQQRIQPDDLVRALQDRYPGATALATLADPAWLIETARRSLELPGATLLQIYAPEPDRCGFPSDQAFEICERAVRSGVIRPRGFLSDVPDGESPPDAAKAVDWALPQRRLRAHFDLRPKGHESDDLVPLRDFLALSPAQRGTQRPYVRIPAELGGSGDALALPSPAFVEFVESRMAVQSAPVATDEPSQPDRTDVGTAEPTPSAAADGDQRQRLVQRLLELSGFADAELTLADLVASRDDESRDPP
ncbi:MAG: 4Fe-4S binding protein [Candidatus Competibacterales bacterium]|nr:4Fe-4S binding protein [Candidatus Competibacterales bacterium]